jgi:hypothetical protein
MGHPTAVDRYIRLFGMYAFAEDVLGDRVRATEVEAARLQRPLVLREQRSRLAPPVAAGP